MAKKINLFLLLLVLFSFSFVSAVPPVQTTTIADNGLEIEANNQNYLQQNIDHTFRFRVYNATNNDFKDSTQVQCSFGIVDDNGNVVFSEANVTETNYIFSIKVLGNNLSEIGIYHKGINCKTIANGDGGVLTQSFEVTPTGTQIDTPKSILYSTFILFLLFIFGMLFYGYSVIPKDTRDDEGFVINVSKLEYIKPILLGLCWIVLTSITFIISNIAIAYLSTGLVGSFLFLIFRLMMLSNLVIIPLMIIRMIQRIVLSKEMLGLIERGVKF